MNQKQIYPIAEITNTSGLKGEVRLKPFNRFSIEYILKRALQIGTSFDNIVNLKLENANGNGNKMRFKFKGIDSIEKAQNILGKTIYINVSRDDEINFIGSELIGFEIITDSGDKIGDLIDVMWLPANDVYVVFNGQKEILIPIIPEVVHSINYENEEIIIADMDGLVD
jgi:16S rRNA processing protein RimM